MPKIKVLYLRAGVDEEPEIIEIERNDKRKIEELLETDKISGYCERIGSKDYFVIFDAHGITVSYVRDVSDINEYSGAIKHCGNLMICGIEENDGSVDFCDLTSSDEKRICKNIFYNGNSYCLFSSEAKKKYKLGV